MLQIIAHRGASAYEPENTCRAVKRALEMGVDAVEVDVRLSKDGHIVVIHDATVDRTTDEKGRVADMTREELRSLDAGRGESIPTLNEILKLVAGRAELVIEIKVSAAEADVIDAVKEARFEDRVTITSFVHPIVKRVKELEPGIRTGVIFYGRPVRISRLAIDATADVLCPHYTYVDVGMVREAKEQGLRIYPWTVNQPDDMRRLIDMEVDGIVTNKPDALKSVISSL